MGCFAKSGSMLRIIEQAISPNVNIFITRVNFHFMPTLPSWWYKNFNSQIESDDKLCWYFRIVENKPQHFLKQNMIQGVQDRSFVVKKWSCWSFTKIQVYNPPSHFTPKQRATNLSKRAWTFLSLRGLPQLLAVSCHCYQSNPYFVQGIV